MLKPQICHLQRELGPTACVRECVCVCLIPESCWFWDLAGMSANLCCFVLIVKSPGFAFYSGLSRWACPALCSWGGSAASDSTPLSPVSALISGGPGFLWYGQWSVRALAQTDSLSACCSPPIWCLPDGNWTPLSCTTTQHEQTLPVTVQESEGK